MRLSHAFHDVVLKLVATRSAQGTVMNSCYSLADSSRFSIGPKQPHTTHHYELTVLLVAPPSQRFVVFPLDII